MHATHADDDELDLLAERGVDRVRLPDAPRPTSATASCPPRELWERGVPVSFGADSNMRLDPFEEARETEGCARRQSGRRNVLVRPGRGRPGAVAVGLPHGPRRARLGLAAPQLAAGAPADLVALDLAHPEIADVPPEHLPAAVLFSGTAALVRETGRRRPPRVNGARSPVKAGC